MTRTYTLKRRAEQQAETRHRIVEAAVEMHSTVGPARTTISMIAERAGVQRHTVYAHFPNERSLYLACSGLTVERDPPPEAGSWRAIGDRDERLRTGLADIYDWYGRNSELVSRVLRDAEDHPLTREVTELRLGPYLKAIRDVLGARLTARQRVVLEVALSFYTWRTLVRDNGLSRTAAVETMVQAVRCANRGRKAS